MKPDDSVTRFELVPYFHGKILDISEGISRAFPHFISHIELGVREPEQLGLFADRSLDGICSSYLLHRMTPEHVSETLKEWERVVRPGGHLMIHLPEEVDRLSWDLLCFKKLESGVLYVYRLTKDGDTWNNPKPEKTVGVVRLGAFGDLIQASSIFPWLKEQGFHVTLYCSDHGFPVVEHDPHIDRFIIQGRDEVPPQVLKDFWDHERAKYDRWINLSESVEGTLLAAQGSARFEWPNEVRASLMDKNYLELTHEIAQVPPPYRPKFYSTPKEREKARWQKRQWGKVILWSLSGSSVHKTWPHVDAVIARLMLETDVHVVLVGDEACQILEQGWNDPRVHCKSGQWTIRESMAFAEVADVIVGTETGLLNAAGMMDVPKVVLLSHSSSEMLCKYWSKVTVLRQPKGVGCSKQPCRQLHESWDDCPKHEETGTALCQFHIGPEMMLKAIRSAL